VRSRAAGDPELAGPLNVPEHVVRGSGGSGHTAASRRRRRIGTFLGGTDTHLTPCGQIQTIGDAIVDQPVPRHRRQRAAGRWWKDGTGQRPDRGTPIRRNTVRPASCREHPGLKGIPDNQPGVRRLASAPMPATCRAPALSLRRLRCRHIPGNHLSAPRGHRRHSVGPPDATWAPRQRHQSTTARSGWVGAGGQTSVDRHDHQPGGCS